MMEGRGNSETGLHPSLRRLALYASGDLRGFAAWRTGWHVRRCRRCIQEAGEFRAARAELKRSAERQALAVLGALPKWKRMEREMAGNIAVGIAAARCIDRIGRKRMPVLRGAVAGIALAALFAAGWIAHVPKRQAPHLLASAEHAFDGTTADATNADRSAETIVETTPEGIAVHTSAASLTILHPALAVVSLGRGHGVAASYIDEETGEVTITNVYGR